MSIDSVLLAVAGLLLVAELGGYVVRRAMLQKLNLLLAKLAEVHVLTNSTLARTTTDLQIAVVKIEALERIVSSLNQAKTVADTVASHLAEKVPHE
jgi:hypothetical protein